MSVDEFKAFLGTPGGGEMARCYYPLRCDTFGRGCANNCLYCYARSVLSFRGLWNAESPATIDVDRLSGYLYRAFVKGARGAIPHYLRQRQPLRLGGMTDCFQSGERAKRVTLATLRLLRDWRYPYIILTKNALIADDEYLAALDQALAYVQVTITTPFEDVAAVFEPGASRVGERLAAIEKLGRLGFKTAVRINPLFPTHSDGHFSRGRESKEFRYFHWALLEAIAASGGQTVIAGFVRLSAWNLRWIRERTGEDVSWLFDPAAKVRNSALHFSTEEKRYYYETAARECRRLGMEFSICYDGDDAYDSFKYLWANPEDCCNGKGRVPAFGK